MIDASDMEIAAMKQCLKAFGQSAEMIGFDKPLGAYSQDEALQVIDAIVTCYTDAMVDAHEVAKFPPVQGLSKPVNDPFADLQNDLPWEERP